MPSEFPEFNVEGRMSMRHLAEETPVLFENGVGELLVRTVGKPREVCRVGADLVNGCVDLLGRMGHCGNARRYGATLLALVGDK